MAITRLRADPNPQDGAPGVITDSSGAAYHLVSFGALTVYDLTVTAALTLTLDGGAKGFRHEIEVWLRQDGSGHAVTLPSNVSWNGFTPAINAAASAVSLIRVVTVDGGKTWFGEMAAGTHIAADSTGYGTPTGGAKQASFAAGSITLGNLAACVAQLINDMKAGSCPAT